jgi:hypothetical protein
VPDAHLRRRLDNRREKRIARSRVGDAKWALAAAKRIVALAGIAFHPLEEGQDVSVAPAAVADLRPGIEVLGLAADKHHSINRAGTAEQFAARHREPAAVGARLRLGGIEPVGCGVGDQPGHSDRDRGMDGSPVRLRATTPCCADLTTAGSQRPRRRIRRRQQCNRRFPCLVPSQPPAGRARKIRPEAVTPQKRLVLVSAPQAAAMPACAQALSRVRKGIKPQLTAPHLLRHR